MAEANPSSTSPSSASFFSRNLKWIIFSVFLALFVGNLVYNYYVTRNEAFHGAWIIRGALLLLTGSLVFAIFDSFKNPTVSSEIPFIISVKYLNYRSAFVAMALLSLACIPLYLAIMYRNGTGIGPRLNLICGISIQSNLILFLIAVLLDAFNRYLYQKSQRASTATPANLESGVSGSVNPQLGYFSPKSAKGNPSGLASATKVPFESGKFRYAR